MPTYKLIIEYDGTNFSGWAEQPGQRTVQGNLKEALSIILRSPVALQGASRTDAGVHALGQAASFTTGVEIEPGRLVRGLSALCRPDISVVRAEIVPSDFNARFASEGKHYEYKILNRQAPSPLLLNTSWHVPASLHVNRMSEAAKLLEGVHDFNGFRAADCGRDNTERFLSHVKVERSNSELITITVKGTAFLKYMVRIIAGTLVEIGLGRLSENTPNIVFKSGNRAQAGQTAPARGLTLVEVFFPQKKGSPTNRRPLL